MTRKICVVTGTRAEFGLLTPLLHEIERCAGLDLQLVVTGMHLSPEFGSTYKEIEKAGFSIDEKVEILLSSDTPQAISKSIGLAMSSFTDVFKRLKPDIIVGLGDRFELFGIVAAALLDRIPVAHLHGGEVTEGVCDEAFRHCITKMSHLHFTSTEQYRKRVIQLGEDPNRVFNVGAIGIDNIKNLQLLTKCELEKDLDFIFGEFNFLVTFHPVTLEKNTAQYQFQNILDAIDELEDTTLIFTKANADIDGRIINSMIDDFVSKRKQRVRAFASMGQLRYLSAMKYSNAVVGNSSSGIIEAPSFKIGTINIGNRQKGRIRASSVIDCQPEKEEILAAVKKIYSKEFQERLRTIDNPYGDGNTAKQIVEILRSYDLTDIMFKSFYDLSFEYGGQNVSEE